MARKAILVCVICSWTRTCVSLEQISQDPESSCPVMTENGIAGQSLFQINHKRKHGHFSRGTAETKSKSELKKPCHGGDDQREAFQSKKGGEKNIYGRPLVSCAKNPGSSAKGGLCSYAPDAEDPGRHQVCVTELPKHFSRKGGQGDWSEPETGREWCACIWAYSNWVLNHDVKEMPVKCDAVAERVLVSDYAMEAWASCGQMTSDGEFRQCKGYKKALETLCTHCKSDDQAPDDDAKHELAKKCKSMYNAAAKFGK